MAPYTTDKNIVHGGKFDYEPNPRGLGYVFYECMKKNADLVAQIDAPTGEFETFGTVLQKSVSTAVELRKRGIKKGDILGICSYNHLNSSVPFIAGHMLGCLLASFDPTLSLEDTVHLMKQVDCKMIFVSDNAVELIEEAIDMSGSETKMVVFGEHKVHLSFSEFLKAYEENKASKCKSSGNCKTPGDCKSSGVCKSSGDCKSPEKCNSPENCKSPGNSISSEDLENFRPVPAQSLKDTAVIIFSSGTTGLPKGICLNHYAIIMQSALCLQYFFDKGITFKINYNGTEATYKDPAMSFASLYWISTVLFLTSSTLNGYCRIICRQFDPKLAWHCINKYKVVTMFGAPCQLLDLIREKTEGSDVSNLTDMLVGGSPISEEQIMRARKTFPTTNIIQGCGQTEVSGCFTLFNSNDPEDLKLLTKNPKSCGRPVKGVTFKVVDIETQETLGPNQKGELRVKTEYKMNGYYNKDSSDCWDSDGFLKTGDVLYYDEDFCFYHVDRIKEMLKYKSWHVAPAALEAILHTHPAVSHAVVVGLPHPEDGDHPLAFVVLNKNARASSEEILEYVNEKVDDRHRLRGGLLFLDEMPLTPTGKIKRNELKQKAISVAGELICC